MPDQVAHSRKELATILSIAFSGERQSSRDGVPIGSIPLGQKSKRNKKF